MVELEGKLLIESEKIGVSVYDFDFELYFSCKHPYMPSSELFCVLRKGAIRNYAEECAEKKEYGIRLINNISQHQLASELSEWYTHIHLYTPLSLCVDKFPEIEEIEETFGWPVFIKGSRQTSHHNPELAIAENADQYVSIREKYKNDPILHWQKVAVRKFVELAPLGENVPGKVRPSREYRTFWWFRKLVGWGYYWYQITKYTDNDIDKGLEVAEKVAKILKVPFIAIDIAKTMGGEWIVIECNDGQESGYAGVAPKMLWENILNEIHV